jgi:tripartite-type tricarboxylate transporter receptor subunit TctC
MKSKAVALIVALLSLGVLATLVTAAANYPVKPIELVCPYTPASSMDIMARLIADIAPTYTGQPMPVVNKAGAGGSLAAAEVISAKPDGYKLVTLANMFFATTTKTQKIPFDPDDLAPLANFMEYRFGIMVRADSPWKTLNDLLDYGKKNPGQLKWAHTGRGISIHLAALHIFNKAGIQTVDVPYKGTPESLTALLGGHVDASSTVYGPVKDQMLAGKIRFLAVFSDHRYSDQPNVPTVVELGFPDVAKLGTFVGIYAHKKTPEPIKSYLMGASKKIYDDPRFKKGIEQLGEEPVFGGPDFMRERIKRAEEVGVPMLKELGLYVGK